MRQPTQLPSGGFPGANPGLNLRPLGYQAGVLTTRPLGPVIHSSESAGGHVGVELLSACWYPSSTNPALVAGVVRVVDYSLTHKCGRGGGHLRDVADSTSGRQNSAEHAHELWMRMRIGPSGLVVETSAW